MISLNTVHFQIHLIHSYNNMKDLSQYKLILCSKILQIKYLWKSYILLYLLNGIRVSVNMQLLTATTASAQKNINM